MPRMRTLPGAQRARREHRALSFREGFDLRAAGEPWRGLRRRVAARRVPTLRDARLLRRLHIQALATGYAQAPERSISFKLFLQNANHLTPESSSHAKHPQKELRRQICDMIHRAYDQHLMTSTEAAVIAGWMKSFLITLMAWTGAIWMIGRIVTVRGGQREARASCQLAAVPCTSEIYAAASGDQLHHHCAAAARDGVRRDRCGFRCSHDPGELFRPWRMCRRSRLTAVHRCTAGSAGMISKDCPVVMIENDALTWRWARPSCRRLIGWKWRSSPRDRSCSPGDRTRGCDG